MKRRRVVTWYVLPLFFLFCVSPLSLCVSYRSVEFAFGQFVFQSRTMFWCALSFGPV